MICFMKIKRVLLVILVLVSFVLVLDLAAADYCAVDSYTCSDGIDNNGGQEYDYSGACLSSDGVTITSCAGLTVAECETQCSSLGSTYLNADPICLSPYMTEGASAVSAAPSFTGGEGFWQKLWSFLIFWG